MMKDKFLPMVLMRRFLIKNNSLVYISAWLCCYCQVYSAKDSKKLIVFSNIKMSNELST